MKRYVCGFLFDDEKNTVVLIEKNRPAWQAGKLNGVGGKVEDTELYSEAMEREFEEEAGVLVPRKQWTCFCTLQGIEPDSKEVFKVYFFRAFSSELVSKVSSKTEETIRVVALAYNSVVTPTYGEVVPNLAWLIPMALAKGHHRNFYRISEE